MSQRLRPPWRNRALRLLLATGTSALGIEVGGGMAAAQTASPPAPSANTSHPSAPIGLPAMVVTAARTPQPPEQVAAPVDRLGARELADPAALTIDDALRSSPAFSLFRRSSSLTAHPTAQGVSLRGVGPSGASRSLVLLDGVPLNDPFGGWVMWSQLPRLSLAGAEIVRGGGSGVWGSAALGGTVQLLSAAPTRSRGALAVQAGEFGTEGAEALADFVTPADALRIGGRHFETNGFFQYTPAQRGSVDRPLDSTHWLAHADWRHTFDSGWQLSLAGRRFEEERGNGTPLQHNASGESAARLRLNGGLGPTLNFDASAYVQRVAFSSFFSSVTADRTTETPALDQFAVPSIAAGGAFVTTWRHPGAESTTTFGADLRTVRGETRENFLWRDGDFLRRRVAGGRQTIAGVFVSHLQPLGPPAADGAPGTATLALRADRWSNRAGKRIEVERTTGVVLRHDRFPDRDGVELSPSLGLAWRFGSGGTIRAGLYRAFRVPTLNELYRPFRVGDVATEANPSLAIETLDGLDLGFDLRRAAWHASLGVFANRLEHAVANVTLAITPELTRRQRLNLERIRVRGAEASIGWTPNPRWEVTLAYRFTEATVDSAPVAPELEGRQLAQAPRHTGTLALVCRPAEGWRLSVRARALSAQFEDDLNQLRLAPAVVTDVSLAWRFRAATELVLVADNLFDEEVESSRTREGLVALAEPRQLRAGVSISW